MSNRQNVNSYYLCNHRMRKLLLHFVSYESVIVQESLRLKDSSPCPLKKKNIYFPVQSQYKKLAECSSHYSILRILPLMCIMQLGKWQRRQFEFLSITGLGKYCFNISHSKLCSRQGFNFWNTLLELDVKLNQFKRPSKFYYNKVRI